MKKLAPGSYPVPKNNWFTVSVLDRDFLSKISIFSKISI